MDNIYRILISSLLLIGFNIWANDSEDNDKEELNHLFTLKCDSEGIPWYTNEHPFHYIQVYGPEVFTNEEKGLNYLPLSYQETKKIIYYKGTHNRVWQYEIGGNVEVSIDKYVLSNGSDFEKVYNYPQDGMPKGSKTVMHTSSHQAHHPHSITIDRTTLQAEWNFHDEGTYAQFVKPPWTHYKTDCSIVDESVPSEWEKEINTPLDDELKRKRQEIIDNRKI